MTTTTEAQTPWTTTPIKFLCQRKPDKGRPAPISQDRRDGMRVITASQVREDGSLSSDAKFVDPKNETKPPLEDDDILVPTGYPLGRALVYDTEAHGPCTFDSTIIRIRTHTKMDPQYLAAFLRTTTFTSAIRAVQHHQGQAVSIQQLGSCPAPVPSVSEQQAIVLRLRDRSRTFSELLDTKTRSIRLLTELQEKETDDIVTREPARAGSETR